MHTKTIINSSKGRQLIQASTLHLEDQCYCISNPEQTWYGSLSVEPMMPNAQELYSQLNLSLNQDFETRSKTTDETVHEVTQQSIQLKQVETESLQHSKNISIGLDSGMGVAPIIALYQVWKLWQKAAAAKTKQGPYARGPAMHLVVAESHPLSAQDAQTLFKALASDCAELQGLAEQWPILLPGMHRLDIAQGCFTLTLLYGQQHSWRQIVANIDGLVLGLSSLHKKHVDLITQKQRWGEMLRLTQPKVWALVDTADQALLDELGKQQHVQWQEVKPSDQDSTGQS